jgi:ubiquinol-cytochrome c reductase cytochrome c1 subunit
MNIITKIRQFALTAVLLVGAVNGFAAGASLPISLEHVAVDVADQAAVMRGAEFYKTQCMACHTMKYLAHNALAKKAGITLDKMPLNNKEAWFATPPPDLSLIVRQRGSDWVYTYFHVFYSDPGQPIGSNNLLVPGSRMPNVFAALQGEQMRIPYRPHPHAVMTDLSPYYALLKRVKSGSMTQAEFDQTMADLTTFLAYASEPQAEQRVALGKWVIGFLLLFLIVAVLLKHAYWRRIR